MVITKLTAASEEEIVGDEPFRQWPGLMEVKMFAPRRNESRALFDATIPHHEMDDLRKSTLNRHNSRAGTRYNNSKNSVELNVFGYSPNRLYGENPTNCTNLTV